jgi:hypothetical protein
VTPPAACTFSASAFSRAAACFRSGRAALTAASR